MRYVVLVAPELVEQMMRQGYESGTVWCMEGVPVDAKLERISFNRHDDRDIALEFFDDKSPLLESVNVKPIYSRSSPNTMKENDTP